MRFDFLKNLYELHYEMMRVFNKDKQNTIKDATSVYVCVDYFRASTIITATMISVSPFNADTADMSAYIPNQHR